MRAANRKSRRQTYLISVGCFTRKVLFKFNEKKPHLLQRTEKSVLLYFMLWLIGKHGNFPVHPVKKIKRIQ